MEYPIALEAYIETQQGNLLECRQVIYNQLEADAFKIRYNCCFIKTAPLNAEELNEFNMEITINEAIDKVVLFLAKPENKDNNFPIDDVMAELEIPNNLHKTVSQRLFQKHYIKGGPALRNPIIWIDAKGLAYAEELENKHFEELGKPLAPRYLPALPINETCDILFQMHKNDNYSVSWTKETYNAKPSNLGTAKDVLLKKGIIYETLSGRHKTTKLDPEYFETNSFEEANRILTESKNKPLKHALNDNSISIGGDFNGNLIGQSSTVGDANDLSHKAITTPNEKNNTTSKISWYNKPIFEKIIWPILVGLMLLAIAIILNQRYGLSA